jgi:hypothetical protein
MRKKYCVVGDKPFIVHCVTGGVPVLMEENQLTESTLYCKLYLTTGLLEIENAGDHVSVADVVVDDIE